MRENLPLEKPGGALLLAFSQKTRLALSLLKGLDSALDWKQPESLYANDHPIDRRLLSVPMFGPRNFP
jgi:hypothetical protein